MSMQAEKATGRQRSKVTTTRPNGVIAKAAHDEQIKQMAVTIAKNRAAERQAMTADAAYYRAEKRGFEPGHELEDWLAAEEEVARALRLTILSPGSWSSGSAS